MAKTRRKFERELPQVGTVLNGKFKGTTYKATIVKDKNISSGRGIKYDGNIYQSMTAAATAITKQSTNGWIWKY